MDEKELFSQEFIENTYLYFYKRLANHQDAEDLANDVILEALKAIRRKKEIRNFYAWYWQMAHNKYAKFLDMKKYHAVSLDEYTGTMTSDSIFLDDALISEEETRTLNYSISKLSKLQREIIILYYLKEYKISEIAERLKIPESTVKTRLKDAKINIKKGMETMQITGLSSYAPVDVFLSFGGKDAYNYWTKSNDIMIKQIFYACSKKAHTLKEISDEIGVAPVYFEEKMQYWLDNGVIKEVSKGKYITNFCMFPQQLMNDFYYARRNIMNEVCKEILNAIYSVKDKITSLDFYGNNFDYNYLMWILFFYASNAFALQAQEMYIEKCRDRFPKSEEKDTTISGSYVLPDEKVEYRESGLVSWSNCHWHFKTQNYNKVVFANLFEAPPFGDRDNQINDRNINLIMNIFDNPKLELTQNDEETVANLISLGYLRKDKDGIWLTFPVMPLYVESEIANKIFKDATKSIAEKYYDVLGSLFEKMFLHETREDLHGLFIQERIWEAFDARTRLFWLGMNTEGILAIPEDYEKSAAGIAFYYSK